MKKGVSFVWEDPCQNAFENIKEYIIKPSVMVVSISGKLFLLYVRVLDHSLVLCSHRRMMKVTSKPSTISIEPWLGLKVATIQSRRNTSHSFSPSKRHKITWSSRPFTSFSRVNPLRIFLTKTGSLHSRLANWTILLSQYDMTFVSQKAIKGQALADLLEAHPILKISKLHEDILDEIIATNMTSSHDVWQMFFDGAWRTGPKGKIM